MILAALVVALWVVPGVVWGMRWDRISQAEGYVGNRLGWVVYGVLCGPFTYFGAPKDQYEP